MSEHRDPADLGALLAEHQSALDSLAAREVDTGYVDWSPDLFATTTRPRKGSRPRIRGRYNISPAGTVEGFGLIRFGGSNVTRGNGYYMLTLPVPANNPDPEGFTCIGEGVIGWDSFSHRVFTLHVCGLTGFKNNQRAVMAPDGGFFVDQTTPGSGADLENIHYRFRYEAL